MDNLKPNKTEKLFLTIAYNRFYDIFDEVMEDSFWRKRKTYRFSKIKDGFSVYTELLNYEPIKHTVKKLKITRPPMESEIGGELFKIVRNIILHFPFFNTWDDIWFNKEIINWNKPNQTIDKFFEKYKGSRTIKYRFWQHSKKKMTYLSINFPPRYNKNTKVYLKDILTEKDGVRFSFILMKQILDTQVVQDKNSPPDFVLMAQVVIPTSHTE